MPKRAVIAAKIAIAAEPKNKNHFPCSMASPKVGGPMATPKTSLSHTNR